MILITLLLLLIAIPLGLFVFVYLKVRATGKFHVPPADANSVIVITGCDSGIGRAIAEKLLRHNYFVVATIFTTQGDESLKAYAESKGKADNLSTIKTDITNEESVLALRDHVESLTKSGKQVVGLVNNAGVALVGPIEVQPIKQFKRQVEVNLFGHVHVTQVLLPFIREAKGRIVNTVSLAGRAAAPVMGAYAASKFAMEAFTDSLRQEVKLWKVSVTAIEPGFIRTPLVETSINNWNNLLPNAKTLYEHLYKKAEKGHKLILSYAISPDNVADAMYHALTSSTPKTRYLVGTDAKIIGNLWPVLPDRFKDFLGQALNGN